jgi:hypothetical protein
MSQSTTRHFSSVVPLAAVGAYVRSVHLLDPIHHHVHIPQKTVRYRPSEKLVDALVTILAGAHALCEVNDRLRSDTALQRAFGRSGCAEQSVVQDTLDACTQDSVRQMRFAVESILTSCARSSRHRFDRGLLVLELDFTGLICGHLREGARKGYFARAHQRERPHVRGRQLGRVVAVAYDEVVCDLLFEGNRQLNGEYQTLVLSAERALGLGPERRTRTLLRSDSAAGGVDAINWMLGRGYQLHIRMCSTPRAEALAETVERWYADVRHPGRSVGWITRGAEDYHAPVRLLATRQVDAQGRVVTGAIISTVRPHEAANLAAVQPEERRADGLEALTYAWAYDARAGGIEIEIKEDKQGLGIEGRQKKRFAAAEMVVLLNQLAHNVLVWARRWMEPYVPGLERVGLLRLVRDVLHISGAVDFDPERQMVRVVLNKAAPRARELAAALTAQLMAQHIDVRVGEI